MTDPGEEVYVFKAEKSGLYQGDDYLVAPNALPENVVVPLVIYQGDERHVIGDATVRGEEVIGRIVSDEGKAKIGDMLKGGPLRFYSFGPVIDPLPPLIDQIKASLVKKIDEELKGMNDTDY